MKNEYTHEDENEVSAGEYLLRRGNIFRQIGKYCFGIGVILLTTIIIMVEVEKIGVNSFWDLYNASVILAILTFLTSICLCCVPLYFIGLHYIGLGTIAVNTDKNIK